MHGFSFGDSHDENKKSKWLNFTASLNKVVDSLLVNVEYMRKLWTKWYIGLQSNPPQVTSYNINLVLCGDDFFFLFCFFMTALCSLDAASEFRRTFYFNS